MAKSTRLTSFLYEDEELLQNFYRIAQQTQGQVRVNTGVLETTVNQLIDNLKVQSSPIKAGNEDGATPRFPQDVADLNAFINWLHMAAITVNGKSFVGATEGPDAANDKIIISVVLKDLGQKTAGKRDGYSEAINNLIEQANTQYGLRIPLVATAAPGAGQSQPGQGSAGQNGKDGQPGQNGAPGQNGRAGQPGQGGGAAVQLGILNGVNVNIEDIVEKATIIRKAYVNNGPLFHNLFSPVQGMGMVLISYNGLTTKGKPEGLSIQQNDNATQTFEAIRSGYTSRANASNQYSSTDLAKIAQCYYDIMIDLREFYGVLLADPALGNVKDELTSQLNLASNYAVKFQEAQRDFSTNAQRNSGGLKPQ